MGREHLISNFIQKGRLLGIKEQELCSLKADVFGPNNNDLVPLLSTIDEYEFDTVMQQLKIKWRSLSVEAARFVDWVLKKKCNVYKAEYCLWQRQKAGITESWQQAQERKNRDLKALRRKEGHRTVQDVMCECKRAVEEEMQAFNLAICGKGEYRLSEDVSHFQLLDSVWASMSKEEQVCHVEAILKYKGGQEKSNFNLTSSILNDRKGRKKSEKLRRHTSASEITPTRHSGCSGHQSDDDDAPAAQHAYQKVYDLQPAYMINNKPFRLVIVQPPASGRDMLCAGCKCDIVWRLDVPGCRLVISHEERFEYPAKKEGKAWRNVQVSRKATHVFYYHPRKNCLYPRFSTEYFQNMPLIIDISARNELIRSGVKFDFSHPALSDICH